MATLKWKNHRGIPQMQLAVKNRPKEFRKQAIRAMELSVAEGARYLQDNLEAAHTETGRERVASGRGQFAGRHVSGNMVGSIGYSDAPERRGTVHWMSFGWFRQYMEDYFRDQDLGTDNIPAARAMWGAYVRARSNFAARMERVARGESIE